MALRGDARERADVFQRLLDQTRLSPREIDRRVAACGSVEYWRRLCPGLSIDTPQPRPKPQVRRLSPRRRAEAVQSLRKYGYFHTLSLIAPASIAHMRSTVETLKTRGWPPVFAFVYDAFWTIWREASMAALLDDALGSGYRMRPHIWCYYVHPIRGARGWSPHADGHGSSGLSLWIPLTDATLDNGCMYLIPKDLIADRVDAGRLFRASQMSVEAFTHLAQSARAMPARAGSVLGWDFEVIHWGGTCSGGGRPRLSLSVEFAAARSAMTDRPVIDMRSEMPRFTKRLRLIARNICRFGGNDAWTFKYVDLGRRLLETMHADADEA